MTEITRVPLQPVGQGAVGKLWLGVVAAVALGAGLAWATVPASVTVETVVAGSGPSPTLEDMVLINYKGTLENGKVFDQGQQAPLPMTGVIPGFTKALLQMQKGGKYKVHIPSSQAYGEVASERVPANSDLNFEIELLDFRNRAEIERQQQMMQQLQQQMQGGAPGAAPPGAVPGAPPAAPQ